MRRVLQLLLLLTLFSRAEADDKAPDASPWSPAVHGLRARLFTTPSKEPQVDKTFDVWIEFEETGIDTSLGLQHRSLTVRFGRPNLQVTVTTPRRQNIAATPRQGPDSVLSWDLIFPPSGRLAFPIGVGGSRPHTVLGQTPAKARLLSFDPQNEWVIPIDNGPYRLGITFQVTGDGQAPAGASGGAGTNGPSAETSGSWTNMIAKPSQPDGVTDPGPSDPGTSGYRGWSGVLELPPIDLPDQVEAVASPSGH